MLFLDKQLKHKHNNWIRPKHPTMSTFQNLEGHDKKGNDN